MYQYQKKQRKNTWSDEDVKEAKESKPKCVRSDPNSPTPSLGIVILVGGETDIPSNCDTKFSPVQKNNINRRQYCQNNPGLSPKKTLVNLSSSRMPKDFIPQKLSFGSAIVSEKASSVLLDGRQQEEKVNLYWYSTEARQLFSPNLPEEENLFVHLQKRIADLNEALRVEESFDGLFNGTLTNEDLSKWEYKKISAKIRCLRKATELALHSMGGVEGENWTGCCMKTVAWANDFGGLEYPKDCHRFNTK
jgi:hypothetical protein